VLMHDTMKEGDVLRVSHPMGDFFLNSTDEADAPLVLISGGIGETPLMSMLDSIVGNHSDRPVTWIHGARTANVRAFHEHINEIKTKKDNLQVSLFNDHPETHEVKGVDYDHIGFVDLSKLDKEKTLFLNDQRTQFYICGPVPFMVLMEKDLAAKGVPAARIHVERFGTGGVPRA